MKYFTVLNFILALILSTMMNLLYRDACKTSNNDGTYLPSINASSSNFLISSSPTSNSSIYSNTQFLSLCSHKIAKLQIKSSYEHLSTNRNNGPNQANRS